MGGQRSDSDGFVLHMNISCVRWVSCRIVLQNSNPIIRIVKRQNSGIFRMAVANSSYLSSDLGIKNPVHKQKLRLKALDVVLFGFSG